MMSISTRPLRTLLTTLGLALAMSSLAACKSEVDDKPKAKIEAAEKIDDKADKTDEQSDAKADAKTLEVDAASSKVAFIGAKQVGDHKGSFETFTGSATVAGDELSALELVVEINSVTTDADPGLKDHLLTGDFFDAGSHPQAKFTLLSAAAKAGDGGATHELAGNLEIRGKANKVTFPATVTISDAGVSSKAEFSINRKQWDIIYDGKADNVIKDDVALILELNFK